MYLIRRQSRGVSVGTQAYQEKVGFPGLFQEIFRFKFNLLYDD